MRVLSDLCLLSYIFLMYVLSSWRINSISMSNRLKSPGLSTLTHEISWLENESPHNRQISLLHEMSTCHLAQIKVKTTKTAYCIYTLNALELLQDIDADWRQLAGLLLLSLCYYRRMWPTDANHMLLAS